MCIVIVSFVHEQPKESPNHRWMRKHFSILHLKLPYLHTLWVYRKGMKEPKNLGSIMVNAPAVCKNLGDLPYQLRCSPDGKHVSFVYDGSLYVKAVD